MLARKALAGTAGAPKVYVEDVFSTYLYTGTGATNTISNSIDLSTNGGLVWIKNRNDALTHTLHDSARGSTKRLRINTDAETTVSDLVTSFNSNGFTLGADAGNSGGNFSSVYTYASWTFRKAKKFFDVVTYTGNGTAGRQIAHNLGSAPGMVIVKCTSHAYDWECWHRSLPTDNVIRLNTSDAAFDEDTYGINFWNKTAPTSTNVTLGDYISVNNNGYTYVMYVFAHDAGGFGDAGSDSIIKCGSFTCDGSGNAEVDLGWEPQWLLRKRSDGAVDWVITDNMRGWTNGGDDAFLYPNLSNAEASANRGHCTATGFTVTNQTASSVHIYIAIRRGPMKTPTSGTSVYSFDYRNATAPGYTSGFPVDLVIDTWKSGDNRRISSRLQGAVLMQTNSTIAETSDSTRKYDYMDGWSTDTGSSTDVLSWMFRRAPSFMDVVCYSGTGVNRTVSHNLGAVPEFIIVKARDDGTSLWRCYAAPLGATKYIDLNSTGAEATSNTPWNDTTPTSSVFTVGTSSRTNDSALKYVAYLFASLSGVSKVGSYTGNGSSVAVTTGFQPRFIMVKRTDSTGNWIVGDSARGLVSADEPALFLNSTAAQTTGQDWVDVSSTGFTVNETALNANVNTGTYLYLAVA